MLIWFFLDIPKSTSPKSEMTFREMLTLNLIPNQVVDHKNSPHARAKRTAVHHTNYVMDRSTPPKFSFFDLLQFQIS